MGLQPWLFLLSMISFRLPTLIESLGEYCPLYINSTASKLVYTYWPVDLRDIIDAYTAVYGFHGYAAAVNGLQSVRHPVVILTRYLFSMFFFK